MCSKQQCVGMFFLLNGICTCEENDCAMIESVKCTGICVTCDESITVDTVTEARVVSVYIIWWKCTRLQCIDCFDRQVFRTVSLSSVIFHLNGYKTGYNLLINEAAVAATVDRVV